jgi:restriction endonuclease-like protein
MPDENDLIRVQREIYLSHYEFVFDDTMEHVGSRCESPIERVMLAALIAETAGREFNWMRHQPKDLGSGWGRDGEYGYSQVEIGPYRVDFLISHYIVGMYQRHIVVECDGHDFHERTKEQAARDKQRDRWFQGQNYRVLRFTGSEIWRKPFECAHEVFKMVDAP